jgi:hypothetical protein
MVYLAVSMGSNEVFILSQAQTIDMLFYCDLPHCLTCVNITNCS